MTDSLKTFLYISLLILGFFIWQAWQKDFNSPAQEVQQTQKVIADAPRMELNVNNTPAGLPEIPVSSETSKTSASTVNKNISIKTDLMDIELNPVGGNITSLKLIKYPVSLEKKDIPTQLLQDDLQKTYVAQSGLQSVVGPDTNEGQALFSSKLQAYSLEKNKDNLEVHLNWTNDEGLQVAKIYTFHRDSYLIDVNYQVVNNSDENWQGRFYGQLKRKKPESTSGMFGLTTYTGAAISSPDKRFEKKTFDQIADKGIGNEFQWKTQVPNSWVAMVEHYFVSAWVPENSNDKYDLYSLASRDASYRVGLKGHWVVVKPGEKKNIGAKLYVGPEDTVKLKEIAKGLELTVDYGILWPISQLLFSIMNAIHSYLGNWGLAIILVTGLIKLCFFRLSAKGYRSMANMRRLQPKLTALKERYGEDRQKMSQAMMELYKKEKINPLGGCLPLVIQIPIFIALYWVLIESVELRQAPFYLWIHDLSVKDPFYVLPLLMGLTMFIQQRLSPPPPDPMQAKMMMFMPVFFTALFLNFPAGLVLYWVVNNSLSITQQWWITRSIEGNAKGKS